MTCMPYGMINYTRINYVIILHELHMTLEALTSQGSIEYILNYLLNTYSQNLDSIFVHLDLHFNQQKILKEELKIHLAIWRS